LRGVIPQTTIGEYYYNLMAVRHWSSSWSRVGVERFSFG